jgi:hypothetical protein
VTSRNYEVPHHVVFSSLLLLLSYAQIFFLSNQFHTSTVAVEVLNPYRTTSKIKITVLYILSLSFLQKRREEEEEGLLCLAYVKAPPPPTGVRMEYGFVEFHPTHSDFPRSPPPR